MIPQDHTNNNNSRPATLKGDFTADEIVRLNNLRSTFHSHAEYLSRVLDERRLEFARWLLEQGMLDEQCREYEE